MLHIYTLWIIADYDHAIICCVIWYLIVWLGLWFGLGNWELSVELISLRSWQLSEWLDFNYAFLLYINYGSFNVIWSGGGSSY
jgi:hypothetical protein